MKNLAFYGPVWSLMPPAPTAWCIPVPATGNLSGARKAVLLSIILVLFSLTAVPISGLALHLRSESYESNYPLVVVSENGVLLRAGNSLAYPARYETPLNRGVEARLLFMRGNWAQVAVTESQPIAHRAVTEDKRLKSMPRIKATHCRDANQSCAPSATV